MTNKIKKKILCLSSAITGNTPPPGWNSVCKILYYDLSDSFAKTQVRLCKKKKKGIYLFSRDNTGWDLSIFSCCCVLCHATTNTFCYYYSLLSIRSFFFSTTLQIWNLGDKFRKKAIYFCCFETFFTRTGFACVKCDFQQKLQQNAWSWYAENHTTPPPCCCCCCCDRSTFVFCLLPFEPKKKK